MNNFQFYAFTRFTLGIGATACHFELAKVYPDEAAGISTIYRWYSAFTYTGGHLNPKNIGGFESSESEEENDDEEEAAIVSPGRPRTAKTAEKVKAIQEYLEIDSQMSVREHADAWEIDNLQSTGFSGKTLDTKLHLFGCHNCHMNFLNSKLNKKNQSTAQKTFEDIIEEGEWRVFS